MRQCSGRFDSSNPVLKALLCNPFSDQTRRKQYMHRMLYITHFTTLIMHATVSLCFWTFWAAHHGSVPDLQPRPEFKFKTAAHSTTQGGLAVDAG